MAHLLAIISKSVFEAAHRGAKLGETLAIDRYGSSHKALEPLAEGGSLFLVTVRPPDEALWLVAVLESPAHDGAAWRAKKNVVPVRDLSAVRDALRFSNGAGIQAKKGALGMSLQTPRRLTDADAAILRGGAATEKPSAKAAPAEAAPVKAKPAKAKPEKAPPKAGAKPEKAPAPKAPPVPPGDDAPLPDWEEPTLPAWSAEMKALWAEILADPEDLGPRSVLADKLMELGDPWGEYLQLGCRLATMAEDDPARPALAERAERLRCRWGDVYTRQIRAVHAVFKDGWARPGVLGFARGCVERVTIDGGQVGALPALCAAAPIRDLVVQRGEREVRWEGTLAKTKELAHMRRLELSFEREERALEVLSSKHLERVEALDLSGPVTLAVLDKIGASPAFAGLRELRLRGEHREETLGGAVARALAKLPIARLSATSIGLGPDGIRDLASALPLEELRVSYDTLGPTGARALFSAPLTRLRKLSLTMCELGEKGCAALAAAPALAGLHELVLEHGCGFNAKALEAMLAGWALAGLRRVSLSGPLRERGAELLADAEWLGRIEALSLHDAALKAEGARALGRAEAPALRELELFGCGLEETAMGELARGTLLDHVTSLDLARNKCGAEGGKALAAARGISGVRKLRLHYNWMGVGGARALLERMPAARELLLGENNYGSEPMRVAARGLLPELQTLRLFTVGDGKALDGWMASGQARRLRELGLRQTHVSAKAAEVLVRLPELHTLSFSFCTFDPGVAALLRRRLPSGAGFWPELPAT